MSIQVGIGDGEATSRKVDLYWQRSYVGTSQTTTSTGWVDLATVGPTITMATDITQDQQITFGAGLYNSNSGVASGIALQINGAEHTDENFIYDRNGGDFYHTACRTIIAAAQPVNQVHRLRYTVQGNTGTYDSRFLYGMAI